MGLTYVSRRMLSMTNDTELELNTKELEPKYKGNTSFSLTLTLKVGEGLLKSAGQGWSYD